jgi:HSP20 family protein
MSVKVVKTTSTPAQEGASTPSTLPATRNPFLALRQEMDRLFDDFAAGLSWWPFGPRGREVTPFHAFEGLFAPFGGPGIMPRVDVSETEDGYTVTAELPGLDEKDVQVELSDGMLTLRGEKKIEKEDRSKGYHLMERHYGSFQRAFRLPDTINEEKVSASFEKGVLKVVAPKKPEAHKPVRKVEIKGK